MRRRPDPAGIARPSVLVVDERPLDRGACPPDYGTRAASARISRSRWPGESGVSNEPLAGTGWIARVDVLDADDTGLLLRLLGCGRRYMYVPELVVSLSPTQRMRKAYHHPRASHRTHSKAALFPRFRHLPSCWRSESWRGGTRRVNEVEKRMCIFRRLISTKYPRSAYGLSAEMPFRRAFRGTFVALPPRCRMGAPK